MNAAFEGLPDIHDVIPRTAADDGLFAELAAVLDKHNARERFGVTLLHTHFPMADGEVRLEKTNVSARRQTIEPVSAQPGNTIATAWRLGPDGAATTICICPTDHRGNHLGDHIAHGN